MKKVTSTKTTKEEPKQKRSLADAFNTSKGAASNFMSPGKHEANITNFELLDNEKGIAACVEYTAADGDDDEGKKLKQYYSLQSPDGTIGNGVDFLKSDLIKLGYENPDFDDLEAIFKEITKAEPRVEIAVKQNGQWTNAYLQGVIED